ncbi:MAG: radical SAM protein, partial [Treponema sp.]|nr:radical SAM protein [Treponema sp.]
FRGCTHGCIYCDSRSKCYQITHDFEDVQVKSNAPKLLEAALGRKRNKCMISTGSMCDPYIPLENDLRYTRKCLEIIDRYGFGLTILTKSNGILRDLDLLAGINAKTKCVAQITLTTYDENLCKIIEPAVCTTGERFAALETLRNAGIPTVVWLGPLLPFINDTEENLRGILDYCIRAKVYGIVFWGIGMTLRDGNREYFYQKLDEHFPGLSKKYHQKYDRSYGIESDNNRRLTPLFHDICRKHGIVHDRDAVFRYMGTFPSKTAKQLSLF